MRKNALFLLKNCKNRPALWAPPQTPLPPAAGDFASKPPVSGGWSLRPQTYAKNH